MLTEMLTEMFPSLISSAKVIDRLVCEVLQRYSCYYERRLEKSDYISNNMLRGNELNTCTT